MTIAGTIHGVVLNDADERTALGDRFFATPYEAPPRAPVVYIKPRQCVTAGLVRTDATVEIAATVALWFARDAANVDPADAMGHVGAACLALDVSFPRDDHYRPSVAERAGDGFLPLGQFDDPVIPDRIETWIDGQRAHEWCLSRLVRPAPVLISELSRFMTLRAGGLLLIGLPWDAPKLAGPASVAVRASGLPELRTGIEGIAA